jgi:hypothetical protein
MDSSALDIAIADLVKEISRLELSIDGLEKWLWISSAAVAIGVIFEIAFLVHEYLEDRDGWRRGILAPPSRPSFRVLIFEIASVAVVVSGIVGELWVGVVSADRNTDLRSKNTRLVRLVREKAGDAQIIAGNANRGADEAKERASKADVQSESLRQKNLLLQTNLERLRQESAARRLTGQQKAAILKILESGRFPVGVGWNPLDNEARDFGEDFVSVLSVAHWNPIRQFWGPSPYSIAIGFVDEDNPKDSPGFKLLREAIRAIGVEPKILTFREGDTSISPPVKSHVMYLLIGAHPAIPATTSKTP